MKAENILDQLLQIHNLGFYDLESYFKEFNYYCVDKENDQFIFKSSLAIPGIYSIMTTDKIVDLCMYKIIGVLDSAQIYEYAILNYGFINIPIDEPSSFILDNDKFRLSIRIVNYDGFGEQTTIALVKRSVPFGHISKVEITMEPLSNLS